MMLESNYCTFVQGGKLKKCITDKIIVANQAMLTPNKYLFEY